MVNLRRSTLLLAFTAVALFYALLWSPWWYPLSDSALYLNMARALARGEGLKSLRHLHRDVRPLTPLLLAGILKLGGGIGAMHAVMIALTLLSHVLAYFTLRRWFTERTALLATVATAASWWVYANAFTIMTEPLFLVMFWGAMLALGHVPGVSRGRQWALVILAALLMGGAVENRVAAVLLLPGIVFGLWMSNRDVPWKVRCGWLGIFALIFAVLIWDYRRPTLGAQAATMHEETYHWNILVGVKHPLDLPVAAGRWVIESLAAPAAVPFEMHSPWIRGAAGILSIAIFIAACIGWWQLVRGTHWYAAGMAAYFVPYLILWGTRIKPRYMTPIAPVLFIQLNYLAGSLASRVRRRWSATRHGSQASWLNNSGGVLLAMLITLNLVPYAIELYIRHGTSLNFYDAARRGAFAELVDIGAYVEKHSTTDSIIAVNWPPPSSRPPDAIYAPDLRIVQFLCDRKVEFTKGDATVQNPLDQTALDAYLNQIPSDWAIVYYTGRGWPVYHLPLAALPTSGPHWWQLFHRDPATHQFQPVDVPRERDYVRSIPGWKP